MSCFMPFLGECLMVNAFDNPVHQEPDQILENLRQARHLAGLAKG